MDQEGYFKSVCIIETQKNYVDSQKACAKESTRLFDITDDATVTANLKKFLDEIYSKKCKNCLFWAEGKDYRGCTSYKISGTSFSSIKSSCSKIAFVLCEFWNRDYDEKEFRDNTDWNVE